MLNVKAEKGCAYHDTVREKRNGSLVLVSISAAPLIVEGEPMGTIVLYKDISELKRTETALKEAMEKLATTNEKLRVVGRLTRHDVRNKLSVVTGNVILAKKRTLDHPEVSQFLVALTRPRGRSSESSISPETMTHWARKN